MRGKRVKQLRKNLKPKWLAIYAKNKDIMPFKGVFRRFKRDYMLGLINSCGMKIKN